MNRFTPFLMLFLLAFAMGFAQKGIGTNNPHPQAALEISSPDKGLLIPRIALQSSSTLAPLSGVPSSSHESMLVYNTNTSTQNGLDGKGYYYWSSENGGAWTKISSGEAAPDDVRLIGNSLVAANAGPGGNGSSEGTQANRSNNFLGSNAGLSNTTGSNNIFFGFDSGSGNTTGSHNLMFGWRAGRITESGVFNTASSNSIFIGGNTSSHASTSSNEIVIGDAARGKGSNTVVIGNSSTINNYFSGNVHASGMKLTSDVRYKMAITPIVNALSKLMKLRGVKHRWVDKTVNGYNFPSGETTLGVIAQEIEPLFPELVVTDGNGYKSVDYVKLSAVLIEAIKEQQQQIDDQERRLKIIEEKLGIIAN